MPPDAAALVHTPVSDWRARIAPQWRAPLLHLLGFGAIFLVLFAGDWAAMADQWWNSSTYNHILLIPPFVGWLIWLRVPQLMLMRPRAWWPGLALFAGAAAVWLLGTLGGLNLASQAGTVAMLIAGSITILGPRIAAALTFPLAYLLLIVPFGDEFVPLLQTVTAKLTIALIHLTGVKATISGVFIDTPAGLFEVAEACSGVKFLVAMAAFGLLIANTCFTSWARRAVLMTVALAVPILANGVRAWGTIYVAQFKGAAYAGSFDHIVYGWIFFALVIVLVLALAWPFFDRAVDAPMVDVAALDASPALARLTALSTTPLAAIAALLVLAAGVQAWGRSAAALVAPVPAQIALPDVAGWHRTDYAPRVWWQPLALGADHRLLGRYADAAGHRVDVFYALYSRQSEGREAGGFGQGALMPGRGWAWTATTPASADASGEMMRAVGNVTRRAETSYRIGALTTGEGARLRLAVMADRLMLRPRPVAVLIVSAEGDLSAPRDDSIAAFRRSIGPLGAWMDRAAATR